MEQSAGRASFEDSSPVKAGFKVWSENTSIMDKGQALDIARKYKAMVAEHLPLKALYLYGSYSKGNYTEESDIDIAVVVSKRSENYFEDTPLHRSY